MSFFYNSFTRARKWKGSGVNFEFGWPNNRFISLPINEHLELPIVTPSALIIGMILKITLFLSSLATLSLLRRNLIIPWTIHDAFVSPGCTLPVITTTFFLLSSYLEWLKSVIVIIGISMPANDVVKLEVSTTLNEDSFIDGSWKDDYSFFCLYSYIILS